MFNHQFYLSKFIADYNAGRFSNNSVATVERTAASGPHYRVIGIHHLTGNENRGNHNLYLDVVDSTGKRRPERVEWGWQGQRPNEKANPVILDKPPYEPGGNISIGKGQIVWAQVLGQPSDRVSGVTTILPDEGPHNTIGHHSHYVVFMWVEGEAPGPEPPPEPEPPPVDDCAGLKEQVREAIKLMQAALDRLEASDG
jgi:hypothetical protein